MVKKISITNQRLLIFKKGDILYADDGTKVYSYKVIKDIYIKANVSGKLRALKGLMYLV